MKTIQVVLDDTLLRAADAAARRQGVNRSALIRQALRQFLRAGRVTELELQDQKGYAAVPEDLEALAVWEELAEWPDD